MGNMLQVQLQENSSEMPRYLQRKSSAAKTHVRNASAARLVMTFYQFYANKIIILYSYL